MDKKYIILEEDLVIKAEEILDNIGLDITTVTKMMIKKIINEGNVNFLIMNTALSTRNLTSNATTQNTKMTKNKAIGLFKREGFELGGTITFASKNSSAYNYWANPDFMVLEKQWNIILNDWINQEIHLFIIPANSISAYSLVCRADKKNQIDLQIAYEDKSFTDNRSKISFAKYLVKSLKY